MVNTARIMLELVKSIIFIDNLLTCLFKQSLKGVADVTEKKLI